MISASSFKPEFVTLKLISCQVNFYAHVMIDDLNLIGVVRI